MERQFFGSILVLVDGSPLSLRAQELAALIAKKFSSRVTVLHVIAHELMYAQMQRFSHETPEIGGIFTPWVRVPVPRESPAASEITDLYRQKGEEIIADAVFFFKEEGMSVERRLLEHADPAEAIIQEARRENCDLIVMGRSGGEGESKPHLGSVAAEVSNRAKIPVLVAADKGRMSKILVPVDGSKASEKAADHGGALAKKAGVGMTLLYVQESGLFRLRPEVTRKIGTDILSSVAGRLEGVKVDERLESGDPARTIIQVADGGDYDLIVMGGRGHSAVRHVFLGSVSDHVLHYADRAVLLVK